jgi:hypothetical protein
VNDDFSIQLYWDFTGFGGSVEVDSVPGRTLQDVVNAIEGAGQLQTHRFQFLCEGPGRFDSWGLRHFKAD